MDDAVKYLSTLGTINSKFLFACFDYRKDKKGRTYYDKYENIKDTLQNNNNDVFCVYTTVNETLGGKRGKEDVTRARAIWIEDDEVRDEPRTDFPMSPSIVIESSPGKYHYYFLTSTENLDEWDAVMNRMVVDWGCDNKAKDRARVLRLPGYLHRKKLESNFKCRIIKCVKKRTDWELIKKHFPPLEKTKLPNDSNNIETDYSEDASIQALLKSDNYHGSLTSIAMSLSNRGVSRKMQYFTLSGLMNAIPPDLRREEWEARASEEHLYECIDSGLRKVDDENSEEFDLSETPPKKQTERFAREIAFPPDLMGKLCQEILEMAPHPNKAIAMSGAFALVAGIVGRKYNVLGVGLNIYIAILADSGIGKANLKDSINVALRGGGGKLNIGATFAGRSRFTGPKAIFDMLNEGMSRVCVIEEAGLVNESSAGDSSGTNRVMLDLYTSCGYGKWAGDEGYSSKDNNIPALHSPALSVVSVSTPKSFLKALKNKKAEISGEVARLWMIRSLEKKQYLNKDRRDDYSKDVVKQVGSLIKNCIGAQNPEDDYTPVNIDVPEKFQDDSDYWVDKENQYIMEGDHLRRTLCSRAWIKIIKLSAICSLYNGKTEIGEEEYAWAKQAVEDELQFVEDTFTYESSDSLMVIVKAYLILAIQKCVSRQYGDDKKCANKKISTKGMFTHYNISQILKNNATLKEIDDDVTTRSNPKDGLTKCLEYMCQTGLLVKVPWEKVRQYGVKSKVVYQITEDFKMFLDD